MYPVVVSDLDGTLLNKQHELTPRTRDTIQRLSRQGIKFIFATGRHYQDVERIRAQLGIDMYLITSNGARVHNPRGEMIIHHDIPAQLVHPLLAMSKPLVDKVHTNIYKGDQWLLEVGDATLNEFHKESGFTFTLADFDTLDTDAIQKIFFVALSHDDLQPLAEQIRSLYGDQLSITFSLPECLEAMAADVCKGNALTEVLTLKGYTLADAIAFGDGMNDLEMLAEVGKGVIMGNADPMLVKSLPDNERIGHCNDHAVAEYLARLYQL